MRIFYIITFICNGNNCFRRDRGEYCMVLFLQQIVFILFDIKMRFVIFANVNCQTVNLSICQKFISNCQIVNLFCICLLNVKKQSVDFKHLTIIHNHLLGMYVNNQYRCHGAIDYRPPLSKN